MLKLTGFVIFKAFYFNGLIYFVFFSGEPVTDIHVSSGPIKEQHNLIIWHQVRLETEWLYLSCQIQWNSNTYLKPWEL